MSASVPMMIQYYRASALMTVSIRSLVEQLQDALPGREALQRKVKELEHELVLRDLE